jgi:hypothetical protein
MAHILVRNGKKTLFCVCALCVAFSAALPLDGRVLGPRPKVPRRLSTGARAAAASCDNQIPGASRVFAGMSNECRKCLSQSGSDSLSFTLLVFLPAGGKNSHGRPGNSASEFDPKSAELRLWNGLLLWSLRLPEFGHCVASSKQQRGKRKLVPSWTLLGMPCPHNLGFQFWRPNGLHRRKHRYIDQEMTKARMQVASCLQHWMTGTAAAALEKLCSYRAWAERRAQVWTWERSEALEAFIEMNDTLQIPTATKDQPRDIARCNHQS